MVVRVLGNVEHPVDHIVISGSYLLGITAKSESANIWSVSDSGINHTCRLVDPNSARRSAWSCEHHTAPFLDSDRNLVFAMSPPVLHQRDTVCIFKLKNGQLAPGTVIRLSSEMPVNIYRYALQTNGQLLIAGNEGEDHEQEDFVDDDDAREVVAKILLCDPTKEDSPIVKQIVWHRLHDPFFDSIFLLPTGSIIATESHHHMGHSEHGVAIHLWEPSSSLQLADPSRTIESFPTVLDAGTDVYLTVEIAASVLTSTSLILCAVESIMDATPHAESHRSSIRAFSFHGMEEKWSCEPIVGSVRALHHVQSKGTLIAFGSLNEGSQEDPDWALTVTAIDESSGAILRAEKLSYRAFGRRRIACNVADTETSAPIINILFNDGWLSVMDLAQFVQIGFRDLRNTGSQVVPPEPKITRGTINERTAAFLRDGRFTVVAW